MSLMWHQLHSTMPVDYIEDFTAWCRDIIKCVCILSPSTIWVVWLEGMLDQMDQIGPKILQCSYKRNCVVFRFRISRTIVKFVFEIPLKFLKLHPVNFTNLRKGENFQHYSCQLSLFWQKKVTPRMTNQGIIPALC